MSVLAYLKNLFDQPNRIARMEIFMSDLSNRFDALGSKVDDVAADFAAFKDALESNDDQLSPEAEAALGRLEAKLSSLDSAVGDADGSDVPAEPQPEEPTNETPEGPAPSERLPR